VTSIEKFRSASRFSTSILQRSQKTLTIKTSRKDGGMANWEKKRAKWVKEETDKRGEVKGFT
jgi:hypothetical protein